MAATPSADPRAVFHVVVDGEQLGPFRAEWVLERIESGELSWDTLVWREGLDDWVEAEAISELRPPSEEPALGPLLAQTPLFDVGTTLDGDALTGTRNESSVLFSLKNLKALSTPERVVEPAREPSAATASGEGSGLIDIRALANTASEPRRAPAQDHVAVDSLLALSAPHSSLLGAPVVIEPKRERSQGPVIAALATIGVGAVAAAAVAIVMLLNHEPASPAPIAAHDPIGVEAPEVSQPEQRVVIATPTAVSPAGVTVEPERTDAELEEPAVSPPSATERPEPRAVATRQPRTRRVARLPAEPRERRVPPAVPEGDPIALILEPRSDPEPRARPRHGRETPTSSEVQASMRAVESQVAACGQGSHAMVPVQLVFRGDTGRVRSAQVSGTSLPPPVRSCVARAARGAQVSPFDRESFNVRYPFRL